MTDINCAKHTLEKRTSFAGPYLPCTARATAKPSAEERIPFHGYTIIHSALELVCIATVSTSTGSLLDRSASGLSEPELCGIVESARAWRESMLAALVDLVRANIGEVWSETVNCPPARRRRAIISSPSSSQPRCPILTVSSRTPSLYQSPLQRLLKYKTGSLSFWPMSSGHLPPSRLVGYILISVASFTQSTLPRTRSWPGAAWY